MEEHPVSQMYMREVLPSWKDYNVKIFDAVTPKDLYKKHKLDFGIKTSGKKREFTATEKAVWYSHLFLWKHLYENKIDSWIFEHDVDFLDNVLLPASIVLLVKIVLDVPVTIDDTPESKFNSAGEAVSVILVPSPKAE